MVEKRLRGQLGKAFAGAWIPAGKSRLTVAVTTEAAAAQARAEGADAKLVERGEADLTAARAKLDKAGQKASKDVRGWYVDVATNSVVVMAKPGAEAAARKFAKDAGAGSVTVVAAAEQPKPMYDIRGGDQYVINGNTLCSIGFAVAGGFVTAGHCGGVEQPDPRLQQRRPGHLRRLVLPGQRLRLGPDQRQLDPAAVGEQLLRRQRRGGRLGRRRGRQLDLPLRADHRLALRHAARAATRRSTTRRARCPA